jgi:ATP adenylyltransferase
MTRQLYNLSNFRSEEQREKMSRLVNEGRCNFCPDYEGEAKLQDPVLVSDHCRATHNMAPAENATFHFLIVFNRCVEKRSELTSEEWLDLNKMCSRLEEMFEMPGSSLLLRSGDWAYTTASVSHLHAHLIMGSGNPDKKTKVRVG